jgi:hypothetical protein
MTQILTPRHVTDIVHFRGRIWQLLVTSDGDLSYAQSAPEAYWHSGG